MRKQHFAYIYHVHSLFKTFCAPDFIPKLKKWTDKHSKTKFKSSSFNTLSLPCFNVFRELFYFKGKKIVPKNIDELLIYRSLAY
jgi:hypothetical protein